MDIEKRRQYQRAYYRKHKDKLKDRYKSYREKHAEREKQLRHERWLIARYIPPEVQQEILYGEWHVNPYQISSPCPAQLNPWSVSTFEFTN